MSEITDEMVDAALAAYGDGPCCGLGHDDLMRNVLEAALAIAPKEPVNQETLEALTTIVNLKRNRSSADPVTLSKIARAMFECAHTALARAKAVKNEWQPALQQVTDAEAMDALMDASFNSDPSAAEDMFQFLNAMGFTIARLPAPSSQQEQGE